MRDPWNIVLRVRKPGPSQDPNPESHTHRKIRPRQGSTRTHAYYIILLSQINEAFPDNKLPISSYNKHIYEIRPPKREQRVAS